MRIPHLAVAGLLGMAGLITPAIADPLYTITLLETLGGSASQVTAINNEGKRSDRQPI